MREQNCLSLKSSAEGLSVLDQRKLPHEEVWISIETKEDMIECIQSLAVRGAPLIGVAAALCVAHLLYRGASREQARLAAQQLRASRPTAVNLMNALDRIILGPEASDFSKDKVIDLAQTIFDEDVAFCKQMGEQGSRFIENGESILTHCNTGGLATVGSGTALAAIIQAHEQGKKIHVYVDETRPLLQGARLTTWELDKKRVPYTLISDNMAGALMKEKKIQKIFTGSDRVAQNGDAANKIGTYSLAVLANFHKIPFFIVAPSSTFDFKCKSGLEIPIEQRNPDEVRMNWSPSNCTVYNPAFDVTPYALITEVITENGVYKP